MVVITTQNVAFDNKNEDSKTMLIVVITTQNVAFDNFKPADANGNEVVITTQNVAFDNKVAREIVALGL